jgi:UDP-N-acetylglucosamine diphosphorylase / glucose-1-phosphate thymidylyltransferase / UDP-N-acetylgalactosamine diphosphorylase / glucosamine-1-phosphate N-acetyltransferase / galactosamine-1-phosphate N-acetyltransferase
MQAVILAAGRGTRLHPITETRTKAMCPVAGKPMVEHVMDSLVANGISEFILVISPDDEEIVDYFQHQSQIEATIQFVPQTEQLGMGHALFQAAPYIQDDFILSSCDNLVDEKAILRMLALWAGYPPPNGILALLRVGPEELTRMGVVEMDAENRIIRIVEKPTLEEAPSNIGSVPIYLFAYKLIEYLNNIQPSPRGEYELQDAMQDLIEKDGYVYGLLLPHRIDLTTPEDLLHLNIYFLARQNPKSKTNSKNFGRNSHIIQPALIEEDVTIGSNCTIGPNVFIEKGSTIEDNVQIETSVVLRGSKISAGSVVREQVIVQ